MQWCIPKPASVGFQRTGYVLFIQCYWDDQIKDGQKYVINSNKILVEGTECKRTCDNLGVGRRIILK
jgi:hypothetical protein